MTEKTCSSCHYYVASFRSCSVFQYGPTSTRPTTPDLYCERYTPTAQKAAALPAPKKRKAAAVVRLIPVCSSCEAGEGGECHTPGCSFFLRDGPKESLVFHGIDLGAPIVIVEPSDPHFMTVEGQKHYREIMDIPEPKDSETEESNDG